MMNKKFSRTEKQRENLLRGDRLCPGPATGIRCGRFCEIGGIRCRKCKNEYQAVYRTRKDNPCPGPGNGTRCGRLARKGRAYCKECQKEYSDTLLAREDRLCPGPGSGVRCGNFCPARKTCCSHCTHERYILIQFGLSSVEYREIKKAQNNVCALCMDPPPNTHPFRLVVDHNHETGRVRALLCSPCNKMLGFARDSLEILDRAAVYLRKYSSHKLRIAT